MRSRRPSATWNGRAKTSSTPSVACGKGLMASFCVTAAYTPGAAAGPRRITAGSRPSASPIRRKQIVFQEYVDEAQHAGARIKALEKELEQALSDWTFAGEAQDLMALRGVDTLTAITVMAELGDITRFDHAASAHGLCRTCAQRALQRTANGSGARSPRRATRTCGGSWWNRPGAIAFQPARPDTCSAAPNGLRPRCRKSPGKPREDSADATDAFRRAACPKARSARP